MSLPPRKARELMAPAVGAKCRIELRDAELRDAGPRDKNSVSGLFVKLNDDWIVVRENLPESNVQTWIPRESVYSMRVEP